MKTLKEAKAWAALQTHEAPKLLLAEIERLGKQVSVMVEIPNPAPRYNSPVCRGSFEFGNACGRCEKCLGVLFE